ncbi:anti-repressor SinI family protein [Ornithinibacillus bavariensis]|nr:anti-repressor SinI family protein [Ornithinibacillus bavariensis]HAM81668.1 hypothetical protein [Ornithinibacillus sp.]
MLNKTVSKTELDYEWVALIIEAKKLGMSIEEIRLFLLEARQHT